MASVPISQLNPVDEPLTGNETTVVVQNGVTKKVFINKFKSLINKTDIGLSEVDNTSDINKPVSRDQLTALNSKAAINHSHSIDSVADLPTALANKAGRLHGHDITDVAGLRDELDNKADKSHSHQASEVTGLNDAIAQIINNGQIDLTGLMRVGSLDW